jgi:serine/threonine protein kinase
MEQKGMTSGALIRESYQLARKLGEGGMGEVWEVFNPRLPKVKYAIKFLFGHSQTSEQFERFQREAKILTALEHKNITKIHDLDFEHDPPFIVLEYLDGEPLSERLARARLNNQRGLPMPEVLYILEQVGEALKVTHQRGVIHRDLKPENIYLCRQANSSQPLVKVLDFGVSKMSGEQQITQHQQGFLGTPQYMSPEQALGYEDLDHRADQFALGIILYELLSGELPFKGEQIVQIATQIVHGDPPYIRELLPHLSDTAAQALHRALCKSPDDRFPSCEEFVQSFLISATTMAEDDDWSQESKTEVGIRHSILQGLTPLEQHDSTQLSPKMDWESETIQMPYHPVEFQGAQIKPPVIESEMGRTQLMKPHSALGTPYVSSNSNSHLHPPFSSSPNASSGDPSTFPGPEYPEPSISSARYLQARKKSGQLRLISMIMISMVVAASVAFFVSAPLTLGEYSHQLLQKNNAKPIYIQNQMKTELIGVSLSSLKSARKIKKLGRLRRGALPRSLKTIKLRNSNALRASLLLQVKASAFLSNKVSTQHLEAHWFNENGQHSTRSFELLVKPSKRRDGVLYTTQVFTTDQAGRWIVAVTQDDEVIAHLIFEVKS